jgi:outer membrane protein assembly factor BamE (lipoprotein component of BamABCDE complex)
MKSKIITPAIALALLILAGCASAGVKVDPAAAAKIQKGVTTKDQVIALLGAPMTDTLSSNGKEIMAWSYAQARATGVTYIPIVGLFAGGADTKTTSFQVVLDERKIVEDDLWSNSSFETRMGGN